MVRPHKRMGEEKVVRKVTRWKADFRRARGRPKSSWEKHKKAKNLQLEGEDPGSEVVEEDHKRGKDERGIRTGTQGSVK